MKIMGYADRHSVRPGERIRFMVSCEAKSYRADIVRIVCGDLNPDGPGFKEKAVRTAASGAYRGRRQAIVAGSYAIVPHRRALERLASFTFQALIWPTTPGKGRQFICSKWDARHDAGFGVTLEADGALGVLIGDGRGRPAVVSSGVPMLARRWYFVGVAFDADSREVALHQEALVEYPRVQQSARVSAKVRAARAGANEAPLLFAAALDGKAGARPTALYNGKIDSPRLADRALSRAEMGLLATGATAPAIRDAVLGCWDFSRDIPGLEVTDLSPNALHGETVNLPARAMTGHNWTGEVMDWKLAPEQYGAIHFHDDDLYDTGWEIDFELVVPKSLKSGLYAARLRAGGEVDYVPFAVRPLPGREQSICLLLPTASYLAYANERFTFNVPPLEVVSGRLPPLDKYSLYLNEHREMGGSCYDHHSDDSGVCHSSRLRPILNMRPGHVSCLGGHGSSLWQFNADTHITDWLEAQGYAFDVVTDEDLHHEGLSLLEPYRVVISGTHPEYHSTPMWDAMKAWQDRGGRLMYLGANGWYWKIAWHPYLPGVIEVRRCEGGVRAWTAAAGEYYHSFTGEYGGLWRNQGRPPQVLTGVGFTAQGFDVSAPYERLAGSFDPRAAFIFKGVKKGGLIGDFGLIGGGAAGLELDRADLGLGTPPHALVLATSQGRHTDVYLLVCEEINVTVPGLGGTENALVRADMVFYETANGGAVWSTGSIAWAGSLAHNRYDNDVSRITKNVLDRFLDPKPF
jgi:N,N-dimethylformamidase